MYLRGMKLVEIASQLNLPEGTVRRWKSTYKWDSERSDKNNERSDRNSRKKNRKSEMVTAAVDQVLENSELTDKQRLFVACTYAALMPQKHIRKRMDAAMKRQWLKEANV